MSDQNEPNVSSDHHSTQDFDVVVIGGGPAGSTIAPLLAKRGWRVLQVEKDPHPRFHIGESLLPMNLPILDRLGVLSEIERIGIVKHGAEFNTPETEGGPEGGLGPVTYRFAEAINPIYRYAYQVRRSEFDEVLFAHSRRLGVETREGTRITKVEFSPTDRHLVHGIDADGSQRTWSTRYVVDATGRDTFLSRKLKLKERNPKHNSAAVFGHFDEVVRRPGDDAGNISIYWFDHGWFWMIPLQDGSMSVGAVCWPDYLRTRGEDLAEFLWSTIRLCPPVYERMRSANLVGGIARATGNFSYTSKQMGGHGYLLVGDAYAFIDPVFSSGVFLAMNSAELGAEVVDGALRNPDREKSLQRNFERRIRRGLKNFSWFIYRFTSPTMRYLFMQPSNRLRMRQSVISLLAGDVFGRTSMWIPLAAFKAVYYSFSFLQMHRTLPAYMARRRNRQVVFTGGTTSQDPQ